MSVPSPCVGVCDGTDKDPCSGCGRSASERRNWHVFPDRFRISIVRRLHRGGKLTPDAIQRYPDEVLK